MKKTNCPVLSLKKIALEWVEFFRPISKEKFIQILNCVNVFADLAEIKVEITADLQDHVVSVQPIHVGVVLCFFFKCYGEQTLKIHLVKISAFSCEWLPMNICAFILKTATEHQLKNITSDSFISLKLTVGISFGKSFSTVQKPEGKVIFFE